MLKQLVVDLDPKDSLEAKLLLDYLAAGDQQTWIKRCMLVGYLIVTGQLQLADDSDEPRHSANTASTNTEVVAQETVVANKKVLAKKGVGNNLFGIK